MTKKIAVIGLGHFGAHLAVSLAEQGAEVLAIDESDERLAEVKDRVTHTVRLDSTDELALRSQDIQSFDAVVVGIGDDFEASLLTATVLQQLGVPRIIVRATTHRHERILQNVGVKEVVLPAAEAAERLAASLMWENVVDSFALSSEYTIVEARAPEGVAGRTLGELELPARFGLTVVTIKRTRQTAGVLGLLKRTVEEVSGVPTAATLIEAGDVLVLFGSKKSIASFLGE